MTEEGSHSSIVTSSRGKLILYDIWLNALYFMSNDFRTNLVFGKIKQRPFFEILLVA